MQKIHFHFHDKYAVLKNRKALKLFIEDLFLMEGKQLQELSYVFCSDEYLLSINKEFLEHNFYTDVITFDLSSISKKISGEIYLSVDRIKDNANKEGVSFKEELHRVIFHGALHLCGYKDKSAANQKEMRLTEEKYLSLYFK